MFFDGESKIFHYVYFIIHKFFGVDIFESVSGSVSNNNRLCLTCSIKRCKTILQLFFYQNLWIFVSSSFFTKSRQSSFCSVHISLNSTEKPLLSLFENPYSSNKSKLFLIKNIKNTIFQ